MKKLIILLFVLSILITGCSINKVDMESIDSIIDTVLKKNTKLKNVNFEGYSYYIPNGLTFLDKNDYNAVLKDQYGNYYYLYIDVVSKHHNIKKKYSINKKAFYSKAIKKGNKFGYLEINKTGDKYFIEAMYNYMKIESYVDEDHLNTSLADISTILSSIKYNEKILDTTVGENILNYKEKSYNIFDTKKKSSNFLDYEKEYDKTDEKTVDEDNLEIEEEE